MSKSRGNAVEPQEVTRQSGAEILRLWSALVDYGEDQRIGPTVLQTTIDAYRKIRNTLRYLLGALAGLRRRPRPCRWPTCRRWSASSCTGCYELDGQVRASYAAYEFEPVVRALGDFCSNDLSALFFDIRRDLLYCDPPQRLRRRAARTVMDAVVRAPDHLAGADPGLHLRGSLGDAIPGRRPQRDAGVPDDAGRMANDAEAERWAHDRAGDARGHRRDRGASGATSASARRWRRRRACSSPIPSCGRVPRPRPGRDLPHQRRDAGRRRRSGGRLPPRRGLRRRRRAAAGRRHTSAPAAGACCRKCAAPAVPVRALRRGGGDLGHARRMIRASRRLRLLAYAAGAIVVGCRADQALKSLGSSTSPGLPERLLGAGGARWRTDRPSIAVLGPF